MIVRKYRRIVVLILLVLFGLVFSLSISAWSNTSRAGVKDHNLNYTQRTSYANKISLKSTLSEQNYSNDALQLARKGQQRYDAGKFDEAVQLWEEAATAYERMGDREGISKSLINTSQALQNLGLYPKACKTLLQAFAINNPNCSQEQINSFVTNLSQQQGSISPTQAVGLRSLGEILRRQGLLNQSKKVLQLSLSVLKDDSPEFGAVLLSLGNTERALGKQRRDRWDYEVITEIIDRKSQTAALAPYQPALNDYIQAATVTSASPISTIFQAQLNHFKLLLDLQKWWEEQTNRRIASWSKFGEFQLVQRAKDFLSQLEEKLNQDAQALQSQIETTLATVNPNHAAIYAQINFAQGLMQSKQIDKVEPILNAALEQATNLQDQQAESYALGYLGKLYHQQGQISQAIKLTRQALVLVPGQNVTEDAREVTYLWQSQLGSLLREQGDLKGAITAYTAAFNTLQSLRSDLNINNRDVQFDFLQEVKPVYIELADLLLKSELSPSELNTLVVSNGIIQKKGEANKPKNYIEFARRVIESLQLAELDNFFQDPCSQETDVAVQIDDIDPQAAVLYPIVFKDRIEVILSLSGKPLQKTAVPVSEEKVNDVLDQLYDNFDNTTVNTSARNILSTFNPDPQELKENIQRLLPIFKQLYSWLIQPFEIELDTNKIKNLVFVLNGRLQKVPMAALYNSKQYLIEKYGIALVPSLQLVDSKLLKQQQLKVLAAGVSKQVKLQEEVFPALTNVPKELNEIKEAFPASLELLNQEFTVKTIQDQLKSNFPVVHLATHGLFSSNPEKNFIITGDGQSISINELSGLLTKAEKNLELLVLSACETATGDERAVLGLAGVAVRSGARSTLATLWPVGDASTAEVMGKFYQGLKKPGEKKLDALRTAQLSLIKALKTKPPFKEISALPPHPYYWASYVLVGNWQ